jgi:hypothetical protein
LLSQQEAVNESLIQANKKLTLLSNHFNQDAVKLAHEKEVLKKENVIQGDIYMIVPNVAGNTSTSFTIPKNKRRLCIATVSMAY